MVVEGMAKRLGSGAAALASSMGYVERESIDVGDHHVRGIRTSRYIDDLLQEAVASGSHLRLALCSAGVIAGRRVIVAAKSSEGATRWLPVRTLLVTLVTMLVVSGFVVLGVGCAVVYLSNSADLGVRVWQGLTPIAPIAYLAAHLHAAFQAWSWRKGPGPV